MLKWIESEKFYMPFIYILGGVIVYFIIAKIIGDISRIHIHHGKGIDKRKTTIVVLIRNIFKYFIAIIVVILILNLYGINTTSIIASLGVISVIVGLAFQDIIKDLLAGIFLVFDNAYAVGDYVTINGFSGEVISLGLKTTKIKAYTGEVKILSNSSFQEVINYNLNHSKALISVPVSYDVDLKRLEEILEKVRVEVLKKKEVYQMELLGIDQFGDSSIHYLISVECVPVTHFRIKREVLMIIKKIFDEEGIEIPYQQLDVHVKK